MKRPQYTRYALRLEPPAGARPAAGRACSGGRSGSGAGSDARRAEAPVRPDPDDDWSGSAAYARGPDDQALDYADPRAVAAILALQPAGWQEEDDGRTLVFWLEDGAEADAETARRSSASARSAGSRSRASAPAGRTPGGASTSRT